MINTNMQISIFEEKPSGSIIDIDEYSDSVLKIGLKNTWDYIYNVFLENIDFYSNIIDSNELSVLYELGLALENKYDKKMSGQYYTPVDVANLLSSFLLECEGDNICDVGCGTGNLILSYLDLIGYEKARKLISSKRIYLYDSDSVALNICKKTIGIKYGYDLINNINCFCCDFLDKNISLPENSKVISNPPYYKIEKFNNIWNISDVIKETKEYYCAFMEKIFYQSKSSVVITPFSFVSSEKFFSLRKMMCEIGSGCIFSFDNIPGNIFNGKKHGVFNSNTSNSVRAAITVFNNIEKEKGFRISPLIRFANNERNELLKRESLLNTLPKQKQIVNEFDRSFKKIDRKHIDLFNSWTKNSDYTLNDLINNRESGYIIDIPNTCRYYTTACSRKLDRNGSITINLDNINTFSFVYCLINSSFAYWWWRIFDGGITYPVGLLRKMPVPLNLLSDNDIHFFNDMCKTMINDENNYIITKLNAGKLQENIKFPENYRRLINERIIKILSVNMSSKDIETIHNNFFFTKE